MGAWETLVDYTVPSNTTSVVLDNFGTITKDDFIKVVMTYVNPTSSEQGVNLLCNNSVSTNYHRQVIVSTSSTIIAARGNFSAIMDTGNNKTSTSFLLLKLSENGRVNYFNNTNFSNDSSLRTDFYYITSSGATFPNGITSLTFTSSNNAIGANSRIQIYRLAAEKVADITVSSNTTQVDITGLDIKKGDEYLLVSDVLAQISQGSVISLTPNDLTTVTNYYTQWIFGGGSTAAAGRPNTNQMTFVTGVGNNAISHTHIKLSNIGAYTHQSYQLRNAGTSTPVISNDFTSSTAENITSITKLNIKSNETNGIGTGTRFILYKLYEGGN